jgi:hypothetical protein
LPPLYRSLQREDYAALEKFFADDFAQENAGFRIEGKPAFRAFYAFFHQYCRQYCREEVSFREFFPGTNGFVANVVIRFTGLKELSAEVLAGKGYPGMTPVPVGAPVDVGFSSTTC